MGIFSFRSKRPDQDQPVNDAPQEDAVDDPAEEQASETAHTVLKTGIYKLYAFINASHEEKGYSDALTNADASYMNEYLKLLKDQLDNLIREVNTYYHDTLNKIELHIETRTRAGLIDVVDELKAEKKKVEEHLREIDAIKEQYASDAEYSHAVFVSYKRGFRKGMAALTHHQLLNRNGMER